MGRCGLAAYDPGQGPGGVFLWTQSWTFGFHKRQRMSCFGSRDISVGIDTRLRAGRPVFNSRLGHWWDFFSSPPRPDPLWSPPCLLSNGNLGLLPRVWRGRGVKLTTHLHLVPRLMRGTIPPLPQYVFMAWCLVKDRDNFTILFLALLSGGCHDLNKLRSRKLS
jgi:hypothetical protein